MSDWQVGDRAVWDERIPFCAVCAADPDEGLDAPENDGVVLVVEVSPPDTFYGETQCGLTFAGDPQEWCSCQFRKIRPDEQEACEPEFVTLIKRAKRTVTA